jgi:hypothetical protein
MVEKSSTMRKRNSLDIQYLLAGDFQISTSMT